MAAITGAAVPLAGYAQFIEPHHLTIERLDIHIAGLPEAFDGFQIAQISDLHFGEYTGREEIESAVRLTNSLRPSLIAITGDLITSPEEAFFPVTHPVFTEVAQCADILAGLNAPYGVFACFGNHDCFNSNYVREVLAAVHIPVLKNSSRPLEVEGQRIWLAGIDDGIFGVPDFDRALAGITQSDTVILLAHEPDLADEAANHRVALQLSGHSHGGQIRLPLWGAPYLPPLARKYPFGYYRVRNVHLYTNRGIGMIALPYRFNAPPEVTVVTLRTKHS